MILEAGGIGGGSWQMIQDESTCNKLTALSALNRILPSPALTLMDNNTLSNGALLRSTIRSLFVTTFHLFITDRHIPRDGMCVSSTASRCHWFVRVRRLGYNWSLQPGSPCVFKCLTCGDRIQQGIQSRMQVMGKSKASGSSVWNRVSQSQLQQCDPITITE